jgi:hypothetical protein
MPTLTGPALLLAGLLVLAGAQKLLDPTMTVGALRSLGAPVSSALVRIGSGAELAIGAAALSVGGSLLWWAIAASYAGFGVFVVVALRSGTMIGSCGCFGREETPPHWLHVVTDVVLAGGAAAVAIRSPGAPIEAIADDPLAGAAVVGLAVVGLYLVHAVFVSVPRTLAAAPPR